MAIPHEYREKVLEEIVNDGGPVEHAKRFINSAYKSHTRCTSDNCRSDNVYETSIRSVTGQRLGGWGKIYYCLNCHCRWS